MRNERLMRNEPLSLYYIEAGNMRSRKREEFHGKHDNRTLD